jgi:hypothetical protein
MAIEWFLLASATAAAQWARPADLIREWDGLHVTAAEVRIAEDGVLTYSGAVVARYGLTWVNADQLIVRMGVDRSATALGNVTLRDPDGTARAARLDFTWDPDRRTAQALDASILVGEVEIRAARADLTADRWQFSDAELLVCPGPPPVATVRTPELTIVPGRWAELTRPRVAIFGAWLPTLPSYRVNLDPRVQGFQFPTPAYRAGAGLGFRYAPAFLLDERTVVSANLAVFPRRLPTLQVQATRSLLSPGTPPDLAPPRHDLTQRFDFGYFDHILVPSPTAEHEYLSQARHSVTLSSTFNEEVNIRGERFAYSRPLEAIYQRGGSIAGVGVLGQLRAYDMRERRGGESQRLAGMLTLSPPPITLGPNLEGVLRFDANAILGTQDEHGWFRTQAGVVYQAHPALRIGAAWVGSFESGTPRFAIDRVFATDGLHVRGDLELGRTTVRYLSKYDVGLGWYDEEFFASYLVRCLEPFVMYRRFTDDYRIGVWLRLDGFMRAVQGDRFQGGARPASPRTPLHVHPAPGSAPTPGDPNGGGLLPQGLDGADERDDDQTVQGDAEADPYRSGSHHEHGKSDLGPERTLGGTAEEGPPEERGDAPHGKRSPLDVRSQILDETAETLHL